MLLAEELPLAVIFLEQHLVEWNDYRVMLIDKLVAWKSWKYDNELF